MIRVRTTMKGANLKQIFCNPVPLTMKGANLKHASGRRLGLHASD